ncbi:prefoldin subunit 5 [Micractinium conductrix]|uniref:Prefoldin subunit 5 n=1 Tax=Micractinium conductrix TaxID=554055 RepID=A0A2P6VN18_9CHLO|nr:prefoldin subunit 5 [Micractinium conductrix]|eukprot:PSC75447.1 prefoldin subunit 5 [Micractinium conductrix]
MATEQVPLSSLSAEQLLDLRQSLEQEVQTMAQSGLTLQSTAAKFGAAGQAVEYLQDQKQGQPVLLPLTESLYVSGTLESVETVLLEVGTGYYVERDVAGGVDYCRRKVHLVKDKMEQLSQLIKARQEALGQIESLLEARMGEAAAAQQAGAAGAAAGPAAAAQQRK